MKVLILVLSLLLADTSYAATNPEQRCTDLGVNCICAESANDGGTLTQLSNGNDWQFSGSTTKQCTLEPDTTDGISMRRSSNDLTLSTDSTALSLLPSGHSVSTFVARPNNTVFIWDGPGHTIEAGKFLKRTAMRWYVYHTSDYDFSGDNACTNSKFAGMHPHPNNSNHIWMDMVGGGIHLYDWKKYTSATETIPSCCQWGPGFPFPHPADMRGKWWRIEVVIVNRDGEAGGFDLKIYFHNVTDDTVLNSSDVFPGGSGDGLS